MSHKKNDRGNFVIMMISHPNPDIKIEKNGKIMNHNIALDFTRDELELLKFEDLPTTYEHGVVSGKVVAKHMIKDGPLLITTYINPADSYGQQIITDIEKGKLKESSISHKFIIKPIPPAHPGEKGKLMVYKIPLEIAYTEKGQRDGCHMLIAGYMADIYANVEKSILTFNNLKEPLNYQERPLSYGVPLSDMVKFIENDPYLGI